MPQVVSYAGVTALSNANNIDGYDLDTVGSLLNTIKAGLENDQTEDTATLVNVVANQTAIAGEKKFTGHLRSTKTPLEISNNDDVINLNFFNYKMQDTIKYYGNWSSTTAYVYNDLVWYSGWTFICKVANTNVQPDTDSTKWKQLTDVRQSYVDSQDNLKVNITGGTLNSGILNNCSFSGSISGISKNDISGLNNVQNILDINKEISIATQNALDLKANISYVNTQDNLNVKYSDNYNKFLGDWSNATTYGINAVVRYSNNTYVSLVGSNINFQPNTNPTKWNELGVIQSYVDSQDNLKSDLTYVNDQLALKSNITYVDSQDALKANITYVDSQDALKANITYVDSQDALNVKYSDNYNKFLGDWSNATTYGINAVVRYSNNSYVSLVGSNLNFQPNTNPTKWKEIGVIQSYVDSQDALKANITYVDSQDALNVKYSDNYDKYLGDWSNATTYGINALVSYSNSFYISLVGSNVNFQPDTNPLKWKVISSSGGVTQQYVDDADALKANITYVDSQDALNVKYSDNYNKFLGDWSDATTYGINAVVRYSNNSYVSLVGSNINFQPNTNPTKWKEIGVIQSYVDSGLSSKASTTYVDNADALKANITYVDNADALKANITYVDSQDALNVKYSDNYNKFLGDWSDATTYGINAVVRYSNNSYVSLVGSNINFQPNTNPTKWKEIGVIQSYVDSGLSSKASTTYVDNADALKANITYVDSQDNLNVKYTDNYNKYRGDYVAGTTYVINNTVSYSGSFYISLVNSNTGNQPDISTTQWKSLGGGGVSQQYVDDGLALKAPINNPSFTGTVSGITKAMVSLGSVDNTSDLNKPISTATQSALDGKQATLSSSSNLTVNSILSKVFSENFISISNNGTANNYDLNYSNGCVFCLTTNPTNNLVIKLLNCGTDTNRSITFTIIYYNLSMKYCNSVTAFSDGGSTQITLSQASPLFSAGQPILSNSTILIQTFSLMRLLNGTNYCLSNVSNFY